MGLGFEASAVAVPGFLSSSNLNTGPGQTLGNPVLADIAGRDVGRGLNRIDAGLAVRADLIGPLGSVEPAIFMAPHRVGIPIRGVRATVTHGARRYPQPLPPAPKSTPPQHPPNSSVRIALLAMLTLEFGGCGL